MKPSTEQNHQKSQLHGSTLVHLFTQKGYECKKIIRNGQTIYIMKNSGLSTDENLIPEPNPKN